MEPGTYIASEKPLFVFIGRCEPCNRPVRTTTDLFSGDRYPVACPDCGKFVSCERLFAVTSKMSCDSRCESAYGKKCECACGGINHAGVWEKTGEMVASYLEIYRADRERRRIAAEKARNTREERRARIKREAFEAWRGEHAELIAELAGTDWRTHRFPNDFLADMAAMVSRQEPLADWQTDKAERILARRKEVAERIARENAERAASEAARPEQTAVPTGRQFFEGEIIDARIYSGDFATVWKIKVDCGAFNVYGTLPRALESEALPQPYSGEDFQNLGRALIGRRVKIKGNLKPTGKKTGEGYFDRPSNGEFLAETESASV
jgi:hypothetical protein